MTEAARNLAQERIKDEKESILRELDDLDDQSEKAGLRTPPHYALYARKH